MARWESRRRLKVDTLPINRGSVHAQERVPKWQTIFAIRRIAGFPRRSLYDFCQTNVLRRIVFTYVRANIAFRSFPPHREGSRALPRRYLGIFLQQDILLVPIRGFKTHGLVVGRSDGRNSGRRQRSSSVRVRVNGADRWHGAPVPS
jgi:hypothetical protein